MRALLASVAAFAAAASALANSTRLGPGLTGVPGTAELPAEGSCTSCHTGELLRPDGAAQLALRGLPERYAPGERYPLVFEVAHPGIDRLRWGFELTAVDAETMRGSGRFVASDPQNTEMLQGLHGRTYIAHTYPGTAIGKRGGQSWRFDWIAPRDARAVAFYAIAVAANADGSAAGDLVYGSSPEPIAVLAGPASEPGANAE